MDQECDDRDVADGLVAAARVAATKGGVVKETPSLMVAAMAVDNPVTAARVAAAKAGIVEETTSWVAAVMVVDGLQLDWTPSR